MDVEASRTVLLLFLGRYYRDHPDDLAHLLSLVMDESPDGLAERTHEALREMERLARILG